MSADDDNDSELEGSSRYKGPSRSQMRREALDVLKLAQTLTSLSDAQLSHVPLDEHLLVEIRRARAVTQQIARKRQIQFLAKQLRRLDDEELEPIRARLDNDRQQSRVEAAALHHAEQWRERLIAEGDEALTELLAANPDADRQHLRQLARQAKIEREQNRPPHAQRELFRLLRDLLG
ncbi:MAG TPA: ribosome biogenesis factor YjgA [Rudaea sp.]|jgi:ribosome-associated protein|nr:ribosome biogenesis factor YjgA [Rudaea sp.]